jgi:UDP-glucose 4-epimerase
MNRKPLVIFGQGEQTRDFLYVKDAAKAVVTVLENESARNRTLNISSGRETSVRQIAEAVCKSFDLDPHTFIESQAPRPGDVMRHLGDNSLLNSVTGFTPQYTLNDGLQETVEWFKKLPYTAEELLSSEVVRNWE